MSITIELEEPGLQAELARQAAIHGVGIDAYALHLIENAASHSDLHATLPPSEVF